MRNILLGTGAVALAIAAPAMAQNHGKGHGPEHGKEHGNAGHGPEKNAGKAQHGHRADHKGDRGGPPAHVAARAAQYSDHGPDRPRPQMAQDRGGPQRVGPIEAVRDSRDRDLRDMEQRARHFERRATRVADNAPVYRIDRRATQFVEGCPPGLAKKHNGCLPPGQAKQLAAQRSYYNDWWRWRDSGDWNYRYDNGYLYRMRPNTDTIASFVPLLGGALSVGNVWPTGYSASPVPDYYSRYYGYDNPYDYRYADGVMYGVDPQNNTIEQIAALLTGDNWSVGQQMPSGYGVYNVPYQYRSQYYDTPQSMYRYSDGYIYQVDPTTKLVQAAIQLLT